MKTKEKIKIMAIYGTSKRRGRARIQVTQNRNASIKNEGNLGNPGIRLSMGTFMRHIYLRANA